MVFIQVCSGLDTDNAKTSPSVREGVSWGRPLPLYLLHFASFSPLFPYFGLLQHPVWFFWGEGLLPVIDVCMLCDMILHTLDADNILTWFTPTCSLIAPQWLGLLATSNSCQGDEGRVSMYVC